jgi:2-keto-4-pentenoate hydratase
MTLTDNEIQKAADILALADENVAPVEQLTRRYPGMELRDACAIQQVNLARRLRHGLSSPGRAGGHHRWSRHKLADILLRNMVGGQEDVLVDIALDLSNAAI